MKAGRKIELRVKEFAGQQSLSDWDIASQARLSVHVVRRMLDNQRVGEMSISQLAKVADVLGVPTGALFQE